MLRKTLQFTVTFCLASLFIASSHEAVIAQEELIPEENVERIEVTDTLHLPIITREEWQCPDTNPESGTYCYGPEWYSFRNPVSHIVIHHTVTANDSDNWAEEARYIWALHAKAREWTDIGYNYLIAPSGEIFEGRYGGEGITAGHVYMHNIGTVGIALMGNYNERDISPEALESLKLLLNTLFVRYKIDPLELAVDYNGVESYRLTGHKDWLNTECPGESVYPVISILRQEIHNLINERDPLRYLPTTCPEGYTLYDSQCYTYQVSDDFGGYAARVNNIIQDAEGNMYATGYDSSYLYKITPDGQRTTLSSITQFSSSLTIGPDGYIYTPQFINNQIIRIDPDSGSQVVIAETGDGPRDLVFDQFGNLYVANVNDNTVTKILPNGSTVQIDILGEYPIAIASTSEGIIYTANYISDSISRIDRKGNVIEIDSLGILPADIVIDKDDSVYVLNEGTGNITLLPTNSGIQNYIELPFQANAIAIDEHGTIYVSHPDRNAISKITPGRNIETMYDIGETPVEVMVSSNGSIFTANIDGNSITKISFSGEPIQETAPVYRFFNKVTGAHLYTISTEERKTIFDLVDNWTYEGDKFYVFLDKSEETLPVHRFFNTENGAHLYTISEDEKNTILETLPKFTYEGIKYYVYEKASNDTKPVYRFFNTKNGAHVYTISEDEKNTILETRKDLVYEGEKFFVL